MFFRAGFQETPWLRVRAMAARRATKFRKNAFWMVGRSSPARRTQADMAEKHRAASRMQRMPRVRRERVRSAMEGPPFRKFYTFFILSLLVFPVNGAGREDGPGKRPRF